MNQIVIAHYQEEIPWLNQISSNKIIVYNKHTGNNLLPNVGREPHTYLHHIISNYDNLADITIFAQGDVCRHVYRHEWPAILDIVNNDRKLEWQQFGFARQYTEILTFEELFKFVFFSQQQYVNSANFKILKYKPFNGDTEYEIADCELKMDSGLSNYHIYPTHVECIFGANFAVSRERIHLRSKNWYENLIYLTDWHNNPKSAHFFERAWPYIFGEPLPLRLVKFNIDF